jgi:hypothetical protein
MLDGGIRELTARCIESPGYDTEFSHKDLLKYARLLERACHIVSKSRARATQTGLTKNRTGLTKNGDPDMRTSLGRQIAADRRTAMPASTADSSHGNRPPAATTDTADVNAPLWAMETNVEISDYDMPERTSQSPTRAVRSSSCSPRPRAPPARIPTAHAPKYDSTLGTPCAGMLRPEAGPQLGHAPPTPAVGAGEPVNPCSTEGACGREARRNELREWVSGLERTGGAEQLLTMLIRNELSLANLGLCTVDELAEIGVGVAAACEILSRFPNPNRPRRSPQEIGHDVVLSRACTCRP